MSMPYKSVSIMLKRQGDKEHSEHSQSSKIEFFTKIANG